MSNLKISAVSEGSIAQEAGIEPGDILLSINGSEIHDVFDYRFLCAGEEVLLEVKKPDGEILEIDIEKDESEDIGLIFDKPLLDEEKSCRNKCVFCFIDQLPRGMRSSLYYKDDDSRLSFLFGNYITMTNMAQEDLERIVRYRMSPVNISVHTTNPELRAAMLNNRFAGDILEKMRYLAENDITLNAQIVLCRDINDRNELDRTLNDLAPLMPQLNSISVVPVGLTRYREKLPALKAYDKESAREIIRQVEKWQLKFLNATGGRRVFLSDEWYLMSDTSLPGYDHYEGFPQIENGVGMVSAFVKEFADALSSEKRRAVKKNIGIVTGTLAKGVILELAKQAEEYFPGLKITVYPVENRFFGNTVTVSGLLTGADIVEQVRAGFVEQIKEKPERLLLPSNMFRAGTEIFLDDMSMTDLKQSLSVDAEKVEIIGEALLKALVY